jgi:hypothetical protein
MHFCITAGETKMAKEMSFVQAMKDYFGLRPETTNTHFMQELRALLPDDKQWFRDNLPKVGYTIKDAIA